MSEDKTDNVVTEEAATEEVAAAEVVTEEAAAEVVTEEVATVEAVTEAPAEAEEAAPADDEAAKEAAAQAALEQVALAEEAAAAEAAANEAANAEAAAKKAAKKAKKAAKKAADAAAAEAAAAEAAAKAAAADDDDDDDDDDDVADDEVEESTNDDGAVTFSSLGLNPLIVRAVDDEGYETPTPIQAATIPPLLAGKDVLGQAQTGTGKTAAFALPLLSRVDPNLHQTQLLVLAPTRELALQVSEAIRSYATHLNQIRVLPIYGGTGFTYQLKELRRGAHVVVGTPGRVMDHMRRGSLNLDNLQALVLDEADEMLRMGFVDDVEWVLEQTPPTRQIALFSATMPGAIRKIANTHLTEPEIVRIESETRTASTVNQRFRVVGHHHKFEVLKRVLETEKTDGTLIFVRTRVTSAELADRLRSIGYTCEALNGDVAQAQREKTVNALKSGAIDILVATDVAARGLDVDRLTLVVNFDVPHDVEGYVHRIGRTGRAGRDGDAILFVTPRERHVIKQIERSTGQKLSPLILPTTEEVNAQRVERFKSRIVETIEDDAIAFHRDLIVDISRDHDVGLLDVAAALSLLAQGNEPLLLERPPRWEVEAQRYQDRGNDRGNDRYDSRGGNDRYDNRPNRHDPRTDAPRNDDRGGQTEVFRVEVGERDGVRPGNLVGAIAGETGIEGRRIGNIDIRDTHAFIELPVGMPDGVFQDLRDVEVCGRPLRLSRAPDAPRGKSKPRSFKHNAGASRGPKPRAPRKPHRKGKKA